MSTNLTHSTEDYLEVILKRSAENSSVRVTDIAKDLQIAKASVTQAIDNMKKLGLVNTEKYGPISLTEKGKREAKKVRYTHLIIKNFLAKVLKVDEETAEKDACLIEHVMSTTSIIALLEFLEENNALDKEFDSEQIKLLLNPDS